MGMELIQQSLQVSWDLRFKEIENGQIICEHLLRSLIQPALEVCIINDLSQNKNSCS